MSTIYLGMEVTAYGETGQVIRQDDRTGILTVETPDGNLFYVKTPTA